MALGMREYGVTISEDGEGPSDWKVGAIEPTTGVHGDIDYLYTITLDPSAGMAEVFGVATVKCEAVQTDWSPSESGEGYKKTYVPVSVAQYLEGVEAQECGHPNYDPEDYIGEPVPTTCPDCDADMAPVGVCRD